MSEKVSSSSLPSRDNIDDKYKWRLEDIYESNETWEKDFSRVQELADKIVSFKGNLSKDAKTFYEALKSIDEFSSLVDKIFVYARMRRDEDNTNNLYQSMVDRATSMLTESYAKISFFTPELISMDESIIEKYFSILPKLSMYRFKIESVLREKEHILSEKEEVILTLTSEVADAPDDIFTMFNNADIKFPEITDENGEKVELTKGRYITFLESRDRRVRKEAFKAMYQTYSAMRNTLAATLISNVKKNKFYATVRKFNSSLEASLNGDKVDPEVYDKLIDTIADNLNLMDKYLRIRKKALNLDELRLYDLYVPIVESIDKKISFEEAKNMIIECLAPLGEKYIQDLRQAFEGGWIDVYESRGKTSGAYSWGAYLTHPYVLLNYQGNVNDVFTLAHEMGHAMHTFYTNQTQPYVYSGYRIFVAEVASTVNESLLIKYLLDNTTDKKEKAYLLNHYLEQFRGTVFRQVMFAEFEKIIHEKIESGEALTTDSLCEIYFGLNEKFFGREVVLDKDIEMEWSRIPHFYSSFYVYKYATGFAAATAITNAILTEGKPAVDRYMEFLKSGSSDYPLELLKKAGVDLSTPKPVEECLKVFGSILDELEKLL